MCQIRIQKECQKLPDFVQTFIQNCVNFLFCEVKPTYVLHFTASLSVQTKLVPINLETVKYCWNSTGVQSSRLFQSPTNYLTEKLNFLTSSDGTRTDDLGVEQMKHKRNYLVGASTSQAESLVGFREF